MTQSLEVRARAAQESLFQRYDQLNALWTLAEEQLTKFHVPHCVQFDYSDWPGADGYSEYACLGLEKVNGKWRICHGYCTDMSPECDTWTPITECAATVRISAAKHLPKFREAVIAAAERFLPRVDKAIEELQAALSSEDEGNLQELLAERAKLNGKAK